MTTAATAAAPSSRAAAPPEAGVVGGSNAELGKWPDVAAIFAAGEVICSGVLVAPTVVLTAAHCNPFVPDQVLIGAETLAPGNHGERIAVARRIEYPAWQTSYDVLLLVLAAPSTRPPRTIASGWAGADIIDGATVSVVGFGAIDNDGTRYIDPLQEGVTKITDASCARAKGCNLGARPDGELGAGGMGVDSCSGDSGGPLYLTSPRGTYLAGLTSRSYDDATLTCSQGGIYTRPGKIVDWIEAQAGVAVQRGPEPAVEPLTVAIGQGAEVQITANDPVPHRHHYKIATQPSHGAAQVDGDGRVRMCATGAGPGSDAIVVAISDASAAARQVHVTIPVTVLDGVDEGRCELDDGGCGCQGGPRGSAWLAPALLALLLRRGRRAARRDPGFSSKFQ